LNMALLPVEEAVQRVLAGVTPTAPERVPLTAVHGRILAADIVAERTQPPFDGSAMDGYAVRTGDLRGNSIELKVVGESHAGRRFARTVGAGEAVRIFTGAAMPTGADTVVIQEDVDRRGDLISVREAPEAGAYIRRAGGDFRDGDKLLAAGTRLDAGSITLAAAAGHAALSVRKKPRVAILATGDELVEPGGEIGPDQIVSSNPYGLAALIERAGGHAQLLGIAPDDRDAISRKLAEASGADVLVTIGGASVGDRDLVRPALEASGMALDFWKIAMRPGKPMLFGRLDAMRVLGLPGNPLSCLIGARVFLVPLLYRLLGSTRTAMETTLAALAAELPVNGPRQHYIPGILASDASGSAQVTPLPAFDSARLTALTGANVLIVRAPDATAAPLGARVTVLSAEF
jgi:molybdopterin molybdotransferase